MKQWYNAGMEKFIEKISSYNIFNNLFPGTILGVALEFILKIPFSTLHILVELFVFYFIGMVISRIGSLVVEPLLKQVRFVKFTSYHDFVEASKKDDKIITFSETANMFRTVIVLCVAFMALVVFKLSINASCSWWGALVGSSALLGLFLFSYKKQVSYIVKRIELIKGSKNDK